MMGGHDMNSFSTHKSSSSRSKVFFVISADSLLVRHGFPRKVDILTGSARILVDRPGLEHNRFLEAPDRILAYSSLLRST